MAPRSEFTARDPLTSRLWAWRLDGDVFAPEADVAADQSWTASAPFPVTLRPGDLVV